MLTEANRELALKLYEIGAITFGEFRLKLHEKYPNAPLSPIYIDLRVLRSFPDALDSAVRVYEQLSSELRFDCYADVPTAATPIVAVLSHKTRIPMISPRKEVKEVKGHGTRRPIDGVFREGQVALLVDDLITAADSKLEAISVLEENGLRVHDVVILVDREQGGVEELERRGYSCRAAFKLKELIKTYLDLHKITQHQYDKTMSYLENARA